ncbi:MAG: hypothetical protein ACI85O_000953 [Saprospiraceae bacterium]|jgi:hypothetical protein
MILKITLTITTFLFLCLNIYAQNVGIGTSDPQAKTHVIQTAAAADGVLIEHSGTSGVGLKLAVTNASNTSEGFSILHSGTGNAIYSESTGGRAIYGLSTGYNINCITGETTGGYCAAGDFLTSGTGSWGIGIATTGTNSTGIHVETNAPGSRAAQFISNGASAGSNIPAVEIISTNVNMDGLWVRATSFSDPDDNEYTTAIWANGATVGLYASSQYYYDQDYAVYADGGLGTNGTKQFAIDHPLDPANKILRHYSIESNEVTNMYRGTIQLDANGQAVVELPDYFDAVNTEPSYQLTAIGTPTHPYILVEESNNQFTVAGAPNTKVSWVVYAKRNDATLQYFDRMGKNYDQEEVIKKANIKGKYLTPGAYDKPETLGVFYRDTDRGELDNTGNNMRKSRMNPGSGSILPSAPNTGEVKNK